MVEDQGKVGEAMVSTFSSSFICGKGEISEKASGSLSISEYTGLRNSQLMSSWVPDMKHAMRVPPILFLAAYILYIYIHT